MIKLRNLGYGILALGLVSMTSCKDEEKTETTPVQTEAPASNTTNTTAALNPAHGQPNHRCDLPVGAPLDGSAAMNTQTQVQPQMSGNTSPVRVNNAGTSTGTAMKNPPHGQPGHDCTIPVGADLPQQ